MREQFGVCSVEPGIGHDAGAAVAGARDVDDVQVAFDDEAIEVRPHQVECGGRAEVAEQSRLGVIDGERSLESRVVEQVDLPDREVVGRPPPVVDDGEIAGGGGRIFRGGGHESTL